MAHRYGGSYGRNGADPSTYSLAQGLGWFSIGLGLVELAAPGRLARSLGMEERTELIRAYGTREIMTGIGILSQQDRRHGSGAGSPATRSIWRPSRPDCAPTIHGREASP